MSGTGSSTAYIERAMRHRHHDADTPIDLYRQLAFTDEAYWHATYELELS